MRYLSLFSGIGGFEKGIQQAYELQKMGTESQNSPDTEGRTPQHAECPLCVGYSEIDPYAIQIYEKHFPNHKNWGDITQIRGEELPDFDLLLGGFSCQPFSIAGKRRGFDDTRGTLFFDIARILKAKRPRYFLLENVKGLLSHDGGKTFQTILGVLTDLGYELQWQVLNSKNFGVPQNRERVFIIGHSRGTSRPKVFPIGEGDAKDFNVQEGETKEIVQVNNPVHSNDRVYAKEGISPTLNTAQGGRRQPKIIQKRGNNVDTEHYKEVGMVGALKASNQSNMRSGGTCGVTNGLRIRRLTPIECARLQGFEDDWCEGLSDSRAYKAYGNAVTVNVVKEIIKRLI